MADRGEHGSTRAWRRARAQFAAALPLPCSVCGLPVLPGSDWHLDHVVPRLHGGRAVWPAHKACNLSKGARHVARGIYVDPAPLPDAPGA